MGKIASASTIAIGYSMIVVNTAGAISAAKTPPSAPPTAMHRKNRVRFCTSGRSAASRPCATRAATVKAASWSGSWIRRSGTMPTKVSANGIASTRSTRADRRTSRSGRRPNATMNVIRYRDKGTIHSSGTAAMSLDR